MKLQWFNKNMFPAILLFGIIGGVLLVVAIELTHKFNIKAPYATLVYPLVLFSAILFYKRKQKNEVNYWKAVIITFLVYSIITIVTIVYLKIAGRINENISLLNFPFIPFLKIVATGIITSLTIGLFFLKATSKN